MHEMRWNEMYLPLNTWRCSWASPRKAWRAATHHRGHRGRQGRDDAGWAEQNGKQRGKIFLLGKAWSDFCSHKRMDIWVPSGWNICLLSPSVAQEGTQDPCVPQHPLPHFFLPPHLLPSTLGGCQPHVPPGRVRSPPPTACGGCTAPPCPQHCLQRDGLGHATPLSACIAFRQPGHP